MSDVFLLGGGWDLAAVDATYGRFVAATGSAPAIAVVLLAEPGSEQYFARFAEVLSTAGAAQVRPVFVDADRPLRLADLDGADGVLVGGGLTPGYMAALAGARDVLGAWLAEHDVPYAGFSAGAAVAAATAVIGGWKMLTPAGELTVCPEEVAEDLHDVAVVDGLGLVPFAVDVHASAWGTLPRLVSVVDACLAADGWAIDEDTLLQVTAGGAVSVHGLGRAYHVRGACPGGGVTVEAIGAQPAEAVAASGGAISQATHPELQD